MGTDFGTVKARNVGGAYLLQLELRRPARMLVGALGKVNLPAGHYLYVGHARRGMAARVARHQRLAQEKVGKVHWHIDYLLMQPQIKRARIETFPGQGECALSREIAQREGIGVPVPRFGATDCTQGCAAHLYQMKRALSPQRH